MDIYSFINSKDIAGHCRAIGHEFTPLEKAFIVYLSHKTLLERHDAWKWIIDTQSDMEVPERRWTKYCDSLHSFLNNYITNENRILDIFRADEPDAFYTCEACYSSINVRPDEWSMIFPTLTAAFKGIEDKEKYDDMKGFRIIKRWIGKDESIQVYTTLDGAILSYEECGFTVSEYELRYGFEGMWIEIPTPFKKGDIVYNPQKHENNIYVIERICYWVRDETDERLLEYHRENADLSDLIVSVYEVGRDGRFGGGYPDNYYFDLEYYNGDLVGENRILKALSSYLKDNQGISDDLLINAYEVILSDLRIADQSGYLGYAKEALKIAGLSENEADETVPFTHAKKHSDLYSFIPSRDISDYCRDLKHIFTPVEMAKIIYMSKKPLAVRHKAWQEIIKTQPDMNLTEYTGTKHKRTVYNSLHQFLKDYMKIENKLVANLKTAEPGAVYSYNLYYAADRNNFQYRAVSDYAGPYSTFETVTKSLRAEMKNHDGEQWGRIECIYINKRWCDTGKYLSVSVGASGEILADINYSDHKARKKLLGNKDSEIITTFDDIDLYMPIPFQKGDILARTDNEPFILVNDGYDHMKTNGEGVRMVKAFSNVCTTMYSYKMHENGHVYWDWWAFTPDLEYYRDKLTGMNRALKAISSYMKGKIPAILMMDVCEMILVEERGKDLRESMHYTDEGLELAGLGKNNED